MWISPVCKLLLGSFKCLAYICNSCCLKQSRLVTFCNKINLITQIFKAVVYRRCRKHKNFCLASRFYNFFHEPFCTVHVPFTFIIFFFHRITFEVMTFINNYKVISTPVKSCKIMSICTRFSSFSPHISMI